MKVEFDQYVHLDSPLHRWHPQHKLIGLVSLIFSFSLVDDLRLLPLMLTVTGTLYWLSRLPRSFLVSRLRYPGFFILGVVVLLPLLSGETVIWQWGIVTVRQEGGLAALLIMGRFFSIVSLGFILLGTSSFLALVRALRSLGLPIILADMILLSYRYLLEIQASLAVMVRAMKLRGFQQSVWGHASLKTRLNRSTPFSWHELRQLVALTGTMLIRSYERSERVYQAMRLRGYGTSQFPVQGMSAALSLPSGSRGEQARSLAGLAVILLISVSFVVLNQL